MTCRICGCTNHILCSLPADFSEIYCGWSEHDLCTFCAVHGVPYPGSRHVELVTLTGGLL